MKGLFAILLVAGFSHGTTIAHADECAGGQGPTQVILECAAATEHRTGSHVAPMGVSVASGVTYEYVWLPPCPTALPSVVGAAAMDCGAAHTCLDPTLLQRTLWVRQLTDTNANVVRDGWTTQQTECRDPQEVGLVAQQRALTTQDVITALRRLGVPAATVEAPQYTLVNLETTFFTRPETIDRSLTIIGYTVDVQIAPSSYRWSWGDSTITSSRTAGQPYPSKDVTHTYLRATDPNSSVALRVDVTYAARYRVDGGPWQTIPDVMTIPGPPTDLPVKQAAAVLVAD